MKAGRKPTARRPRRRAARRQRGAALAPQGVKPTWTVMLYLAGDNNLSSEMVRAVNDLARVNGTITNWPSWLKVTVQLDAFSPDFATYRCKFDGKPCKRTLDRALKVPGGEHAEVALSEDSADPSTLAKFIDWSVNEFPDSTHRMLILSGHGSGAVGDFLSDDDARLGQPSSLTIPDLRRALDDAEKLLAERPHVIKKGKVLDVIGMDSCLMSMAEVCYEIREHADFLVGSEGFVPNAGWPYASLFQSVMEPGVAQGNAKGLEPEDLTKCLVDGLKKYYERQIPAGVSADLVGCDLRALEPLAVAVKTLTRELMLRERKVQSHVIVAHWRAQSYKLEQYTDLWDFCDLLSKETRKTYKALSVACDEVKYRIDDIVGGRQWYVGAEFQHSHGLSVYFPWSRSGSTNLRLSGMTVPQIGDGSYYDTLAFSHETHWAAFLSTYLDSTKREPRGEAGDVHCFSAPRRPSERGKRYVEGYNRYVEGYNRYVEGYNKFLATSIGGSLPGSMKNPPDRWCMRRKTLSA